MSWRPFLTLSTLLWLVLLTSTASAFAHIKRDVQGTAQSYTSTRLHSSKEFLANQSDENGGALWNVVTITYVTTEVVTSTTIYSSSTSGSANFYTATYIATDLQTVTTIITSTSTGPSIPEVTCEYALGETPCGSVCCRSGQYCESVGICRDAGGGTPVCNSPCGYYGQLCCAGNEVCYTDADGQAQCGSSSSPSCPNPCGFDGQLCCAAGETCSLDTSTALCVPTTPANPACPLSTTVYTITSSYQSTVLDTVTVVLTRVESGVETIVRTATFQAPAQLCLPELGQIPCGNACCAPGQLCQSPGVCVNQFCPPLRPTTGTIVVVTTAELSTITVPFATPLATAA